MRKHVCHIHPTIFTPSPIKVRRFHTETNIPLSLHSLAGFISNVRTRTVLPGTPCRPSENQFGRIRGTKVSVEAYWCVRICPWNSPGHHKRRVIFVNPDKGLKNCVAWRCDCIKRRTRSLVSGRRDWEKKWDDLLAGWGILTLLPSNNLYRTVSSCFRNKLSGISAELLKLLKCLTSTSGFRTNKLKRVGGSTMPG